MKKLILSLCCTLLLCSAVPAGAATDQTTFEEKIGKDYQKFISLPYLQGYMPAPDKVNVVKYDRARTYKSYRLYSSGHSGAAYLIDLKGNVLHEWTYQLKDIWPELVDQGVTPFWENIYLYPNGDLLAIYNGGGMIKLDKDSNLLWSHRCRAHHDITVDDKGNIYTLTEDKIRLKDDVFGLDNGILVLSPEGKEIRKLSLFKMMLEAKDEQMKDVFRRVVSIIVNGNEDVFHSNTLEWLDGHLAHLNPEVFKKGNLLICMLTISSMAVINPETEQFVWFQGPVIWYQGQHKPELLDNGNILSFDNHYWGSKTQSRVFEFDPFTLKVGWEYLNKGFYSDTQGAVFRLPNGNTLIVESDPGRVFEVTPHKETVWEFLNPHRTGKDNELIAAVYNMYSIEEDYVKSWLK